jgi:hypothetical protein
MPAHQFLNAGLATEFIPPWPVVIEGLGGARASLPGRHWSNIATHHANSLSPQELRELRAEALRWTLWILLLLGAAAALWLR